MSDPSLYTYASPLQGWENLEPLPTEKAADGKSLVNPPSKSLSPSYNSFTPPIADGSRGGFDAHIYFQHTLEEETEFATQLWERIRREFPELRVYPLFNRPIGPHPIGMFEVNIFTPAQFGAFVPWLVVNRGPLSVLLHPNTDDDLRDHTQRATWMGRQWPLQLGGLRKMLQSRKEEEEAKKKTEAQESIN